MENLTISYAEVVVRPLATAVLCGLIGLGRETRDRFAGFRAHILLGLGAALFTLVLGLRFPRVHGGGARMRPGFSARGSGAG